MLTEFLGPNIGTNVFESFYQAFQQGATFGNAMMAGLTTGVGNMITTIGTVFWGSTFNNPGAAVIPLVY